MRIPLGSRPRSGSRAPPKLAWLPHGESDTGLLYNDGLGQSASVPAVATYRGRLWCLWTDLHGQLWYAHTDDSSNSNSSRLQFSRRQPFPENGLPVLASVNGVLHALIVQAESGVMAHYIHDDDDATTKWTALGVLDAPAGFIAHSTPALAALHDQLFLAFLQDGRLLYSVWAAQGGSQQWQWTQPRPVVTQEADARFRGIPALFVMSDKLHLLCGADTEERHILGFCYDAAGDRIWVQSDDVSEGRAASGVSAVSFGSTAYLGLIEDGPGDQSHGVYVAAFRQGTWQPHEPVGGYRGGSGGDVGDVGGSATSAADPPQMAILNGRVHCIFNDNTATRDLRWYSRPVLRYGLSSWMARLDDDLPLSQLTIPGTHDSCARTPIPFVRTQYLTVSQQLALGIRFLDLRLRIHKNDGQLYCYHGGVPMNYPRYLSFASVMEEVWQFLWPDVGGDLGTGPTETVLISINNDDNNSAEHRAAPEMFYNAVAEAIAATPPWPVSARGDSSNGPACDRWHVEAGTPRLGDVRGRAVLLRRYAGDPAVVPTKRQGLDLSAWLNDNPDFTIVTPTQVRVRLQDKWKYVERMTLAQLVQSKAEYVQHMMAHAAGSRVGGEDGEEEEEEQEEHDWYINFCSAVGDPAEHGEVAEAKWIAVGARSDFMGKWVPGMNVEMCGHMQANFDAASGRTRLGIVNLDYPELPEDSDLVARLIETNF